MPSSPDATTQHPSPPIRAQDAQRPSTVLGETDAPQRGCVGASQDPDLARLALERAEAEYFYELALRKERELGEAAGRAEGKAEGEAAGRAEGMAAGRAEGMAEGKAEGRAEGKAEGKAETVLKLITLKFGAPSEAVQERVRSASVEQLDRLAEKILFASHIDALLERD